MVYPHGGGWGCLAVLTSVGLQPGESKEYTFDWGTTQWEYDPAAGRSTYPPLPQGDYQVYAKLDGMMRDQRVELRSSTLRVRVR